MKKAISTTQTPANIAAVMSILADMPAQLEQLRVGLTTDQLTAPLGEGERSFTEMLAHLINCEERTAESIYLALLENEPLFSSVHPERDWGKLLQHETFAFADLLAYFKFRRVVLLHVLNGLSESHWSRVIREEGKQRKESVYWRARGQALHELEHVNEVAAKLKDF